MDKPDTNNNTDKPKQGRDEGKGFSGLPFAASITEWADTIPVKNITIAVGAVNEVDKQTKCCEPCARN